MTIGRHDIVKVNLVIPLHTAKRNKWRAKTSYNLMRCALVLVTLAASGIASAALNYDYTNKVLFDSSTNLYWSSGPKNLGGWQVATGQQVTSLFSEVGAWSFPPSGPSTYSNVVVV